VNHFLNKKKVPKKTIVSLITKLKPSHTTTINCMTQVENKVIVGTSDGKLHIWDAITDKLLESKSIHKSAILCILKVKIDSTVEHLWTSSADQILRVFDTKNYKLLHENKETPATCMIKLGSTVWLGYKSIVSIMDFKSYQILKRIELETEEISHFAYCKGTLYIAVNKLIISIDPISQRIRAYLQGHDKTINHLLINESYLWSASQDNTIRLWDLKTGDCVRKLEAHTGEVQCLFREEGFTWSGSSDKSIIIWDASTGVIVSEFADHNKGISTFCKVDTKIDTRLWVGVDNTIEVYSLHY